MCKRYDLVLEIEDKDLKKVARIIGYPRKRGIAIISSPYYVEKLKKGLIVHYAGKEYFFETPKAAAVTILAIWANTATRLEFMVIVELVRALNKGTAKAVLVKQGW